MDNALIVARIPSFAGNKMVKMRMRAIHLGEVLRGEFAAPFGLSATALARD